MRRTPLRKISNKKRRDNGIYKNARAKVIARDEGWCVLCGRQYQEIHHIIFRSQGGKHNIENLCCLCWECHHIRAHGTKAKEVRNWLQTILKERYGYEYE